MDNTTYSIASEVYAYKSNVGHSRDFRLEARQTAFQIVEKIADFRLSQGLLTVVDAMFLTLEDRNTMANIAKKHNAPFFLIVFDDISLNEIKVRNAQRKDKVPDFVYDSLIDKIAQARQQNKEEEVVLDSNCALSLKNFLTFKKNVCYNQTYYKSQGEFELTLNEIENDNFDVIANINGLYSCAKDLLSSKGWDVEEGIHFEDVNRKLLVLGNSVDKGPLSANTLLMLSKFYENGNLLFVLGISEHFLLQALTVYGRETLSEIGSLGGKGSLHQVLSLPQNQQNKILCMLQNAQLFFTHASSKVVFSSGSLEYFLPYRTMAGHFVHGSDKNLQGVDQAYHQNMQNGICDYSLIKAQPVGFSSPHVFSLNFNPLKNGSLALLSFDAYLQYRKNGCDHFESAQKACAFEETFFDYDSYRSKGFELYLELQALIDKKIVFKTKSPDGTLEMYKYQKRVFFEKLWNEHPLTKKARGLVLDLKGDIVSFGFDKVFNYMEYSTGEDLPADQEVLAVEKLNGFLMFISKHPYKKDDFIFHTSGSFDQTSGSLKLAMDFVTPKFKGLLRRFFNQQETPLTLMFEVIHPEDPHIVKYSEHQKGLYLIGARQLDGSLEGYLYKEEDLDQVALCLELKRPSWKKISFGQLLSESEASDQEGYMVRSVDENQTFLMKLKTPYYLSTKFWARLSKRNTFKMFKNPDVFKKEIDEEFYSFVDYFVSNFTPEEFLAVSEQDKIELTTKIRKLKN